MNLNDIGIGNLDEVDACAFVTCLNVVGNILTFCIGMVEKILDNEVHAMIRLLALAFNMANSIIGFLEDWRLYHTEGSILSVCARIGNSRILPMIFLATRFVVCIKVRGKLNLLFAPFLKLICEC